MSSWVNQNYTEAPLPEFGVSAGGFVGVDLVGAYTLVGAVALLVLYLSFCWVDKWRKARRKMDSVAAGMLRLAAARGDLPDMELLSQVKYFDPNAGIGGFTALHAACVEGQADAVAWLCAKGANVLALKEDGWQDTALHYAASRGHLQVVRILLAFKADPTAKNFQGATPADLAARQKHAIVARYLFEVIEGKRTPPQQAVFVKAVEERLKEAQQGVRRNGDSKELEEKALEEVASRGWEGAGSQGTKLRFTVKLFRVMCIITQTLNMCYLFWRALRSFRSGWYYFYSIPFWFLEFCPFVLSNCWVMSMWNQIDRPPRSLNEMVAMKDFPHVDIFIVTYTEPVEVIEPTAIAALNMHWPGEKLTVNILDDGKRESVQKLVKKLQFQMKYMHREANIVYLGREKRKGVPHHAKAGNINSAILKEGPGQGVFIMVLDCDMIVHPEFLMRTVGHFYRQEEKTERWVLKEKAAFIQTPQDFWNVDAADPMVHCARFFYGPMLQGRDGIGACPCCGTGVVFRRDILASIGGQAYGSITEDYNTAMTLLSAGFATMFLNERLVFGMAPDDIESVFKQRLRWAMGALQILMRTNPLRLVGLTFPQAALFYEAAAHHLLAVTTVAFAVAPLVYIFTEVSPMVCEHLWEFSAVFGSWYLSNRITMWWVHRGCIGGDQELWRGSQMWVWMAPNHLKAIWKVLVAESKLFACFKFEIGFAVTSKDKDKPKETAWTALKKGLRVTWPHIAYYIAYFIGLAYFIITASMAWYTAWQIVIFLSALGWGALICLCIWPPVGTLLPRVETDLGWKIVWDAFVDPAAFAERRRRRREEAASQRLSVQLDGEQQGSLAARGDVGTPRRSMGSPGAAAAAGAAVEAVGRMPLQPIAEGVPADDRAGAPPVVPSRPDAVPSQPEGALPMSEAAPAPAMARAASSTYRSVVIQSASGQVAGTGAGPARAGSITFGRVPSLAHYAGAPGGPSQAGAAPSAAAAEPAAAATAQSDMQSPFFAMQRASSGVAGAAPPATTSNVSPFLAMQQAVTAAPAAARPADLPAPAISPFLAMRQASAPSIPAAPQAAGPSAAGQPPPPSTTTGPATPPADKDREASIKPGPSSGPAAPTAAAGAPAAGAAAEPRPPEGQVMSPFFKMQQQAAAAASSPARLSPTAGVAAAATGASAAAADTVSPFFRMQQAAAAASSPARLSPTAGVATGAATAAAPAADTVSPFAKAQQEAASPANLARPSPRAPRSISFVRSPSSQLGEAQAEPRRRAGKPAAPEGLMRAPTFGRAPTFSQGVADATLSPFAQMQQAATAEPGGTGGQAALDRAPTLSRVPTLSRAPTLGQAPTFARAPTFTPAGVSEAVSPFAKLREEANQPAPAASSEAAASAAASGEPADASKPSTSPFLRLQQQAAAAAPAPAFGGFSLTQPRQEEQQQQQQQQQQRVAVISIPEAKDAAEDAANLTKSGSSGSVARMTKAGSSGSAASLGGSGVQPSAGVSGRLLLSGASSRLPSGGASSRLPPSTSSRLPASAPSRRLRGDRSARLSGQQSTRLSGQQSAHLRSQQSGRLPEEKSGRLPGLLSSMLSWRGASLQGSMFNNSELRSEARSNIGRVGMPEHTARALAASALLTSVVLPERPDTSMTFTHASGSRIGISGEQPILIGIEGDRVVPAEQALASGASVNLGALFSTRLDQPSWMGSTHMSGAQGSGGQGMWLAGAQGSGANGSGSTLGALAEEKDAAVADFMRLTGAMPSAMLGSSGAGMSMALGSIAMGLGRPGLPAITEDVEAGRAAGDGRPSLSLVDGPSLHTVTVEGGGGRLGGAAPSASLGPRMHGMASVGLASRALPSIALHSNAQHSMQLQTRPPANATAEERVAWASQQLRTLASMVSLMPGASLGPATSLAGGMSTMVVPVVPSTIFDHTLAARPNFDLMVMPKSNYMFITINGLLLVAMVVGSVLEVNYKVTGGDHSFSNLN